MADRRNALAHALDRSGVLGLIERLPVTGQLVVVNYHRIGNRSATDFDPEVFSADQETFDAQLRMLRRRYTIVGEDEALEIIKGRAKPRSTAVLLTFDDGYADNLELAVPVLSSHGLPALFFLVTSYLDNPSEIPWWDRIAWLVRLCKGRQLALTQPEPYCIDVGESNAIAVIRAVLARYRSNGIENPVQFMAELEACAGHLQPVPSSRLLMGWEDARRLLEAGMAIGLHSHSHSILSRLTLEEQRRDLESCAASMHERLGIRARSLAYPVGSRDAFSADTKVLARDLGLEAAFSFYGGTNIAGQIDAFDVRRVAFADDAAVTRARAALALLAATRSVWL